MENAGNGLVLHYSFYYYRNRLGDCGIISLLVTREPYNAVPTGKTTRS